MVLPLLTACVAGEVAPTPTALVPGGSVTAANATAGGGPDALRPPRHEYHRAVADAALALLGIPLPENP